MDASNAIAALRTARRLRGIGVRGTSTHSFARFDFEACMAREPIHRAYHPDKQQHGSPAASSDFIVQLTEAYSVLKNEQSRAAYDEELRFFREHGRLRWGLRYRVYPRTNLWAVIVCTGERSV